MAIDQALRRRVDTDSSDREYGQNSWTQYFFGKDRGPLKTHVSSVRSTETAFVAGFIENWRGIDQLNARMAQLRHKIHEQNVVGGSPSRIGLRQSAAAVAASGTTLTQLAGISDVLAAKILGHIGDIGRFPSADRLASYAGTAPIEASSGDVVRHRLSRHGNRQLNNAIHLAAHTQTTAKPRSPSRPGRRLSTRGGAPDEAAGEGATTLTSPRPA